MNPSSLLNVSPDLLREHVRQGMPTGPMASASDRAWAIGFCVTLAVMLTVVLCLAVVA